MMRVMYFILSTPFLRHLLVVVGADIGSIGRLGLRMQRDVREPICQPLLVLFIPPPRDETLRAMRCVAAAHVSVGCCAYAWVAHARRGRGGKGGRKGACKPLVPSTCQNSQV